MNGLIEKVNSLLWGEFTVMIVVICGVYHTIKSGFIQLRLRSRLGHTRDKSSSRAVASALAASMGTGNITGCGAAIAAGGAGAVFWMWTAAFFGMALAYAENRLGAAFAQRYHDNSKGPMLYIEKGLGSKGLASVYAAGCLCAAFGMGCMSQSRAFSDAVAEQTAVSPSAAAVMLCVITAAVVFSSKNASEGVMKAAEKIVPVMGLMYGAGCIILLTVSDADIYGAFREIFMCAFTPRAAAGGAVGITVSKAVSVGLRRGVFSNEAGMGSSVLVHSGADFGSPENAGAWAAFEVFLDTMVCCTLTALAVLTSDGYQTGNIGITEVFSEGLGSFGGIFTCVSICMFAWAAVLGWCCYGEKCIHYLTGGRGSMLYRVLFCVTAAAAGFVSADTVMGLADIANWVIMMVNLAAVTICVCCEKKSAP